MARAYSEDELVEQPAARLLAELGWATESALEETLGSSGSLRRDSGSEVVLLARLRAALAKLNPPLAAEAIAAACDELTRDRSGMTSEAATLDKLPNAYTRPLFSEKCTRVFEHVYETRAG
jgi:type I restriction enzyme, R subunit